MNYTYPKQYKIRKIKDQVKLLENLLGIKTAALFYLDSGVGEGLFAIPHWKLLGSTYNDAVLKVMEVIKKQRSCYDYRSGNWTADYLRQLPIKEKWWNEQEEKIIVISAQFGQEHAGESVESVRKALKSAELPLGIYECLIMLLTHPERLQDYNDLCIDCPGDEYSWDADGAFSKAPILSFGGGEGKFDTRGVSHACGRCGSASGLVPQSSLDTGTLAPSESFNLESAIKIVKENGYKVIKEY